MINYTILHNTLNDLKQNYGKDIFICQEEKTMPQRLRGLLADFMPFYKNERNAIKILYESGAAKHINMASEAEVEYSRLKAISMLVSNAFVTEEFATKLVDVYTEVWFGQKIQSQEEEKQTHAQALDGLEELTEQQIEEQLYICELMGIEPPAKYRPFLEKRNKNEWISCKDRLPDDGQVVLVYKTDGKMDVYKYVPNFADNQFQMQKPFQAINSQALRYGGSMGCSYEMAVAWQKVPEKYDSEVSSGMNNGWIPCDKQLPTVGQRVYICLHNPHGTNIRNILGSNTKALDIQVRTFIGKQDDEQTDMWSPKPYGEILAWQQLPEKPSLT